MKNEIVYLGIHDVIPYEKNPRKNENAVNAVANSIKEFGFRSPIVVDKDMVIINGHTRLLAAKQLGLNEVPVIVASDLNEEQVRAFRLVDNKVAEIAEWDEDLLQEELNLIEELDMSQFGFDEPEFNFDENSGGGQLELNDRQTKEKEIECPFCGEKILL